MKKEFKNISECVSADNEKEKYIIVAKYGDHTLIYRNSKYHPWVVAFMYDKEFQCWGNGSYFGTLWEAMQNIAEKEMPGKIVNLAINLCDKYERQDIGDLLMEMWQENVEEE